MNESGESTVVFEEILSRAQAERRLEPSITSTAEVLVSASYFDERKEVVLEAREKLKKRHFSHL